MDSSGGPAEEVIDDGADGTGLIEIQRPKSQNVKGRAGNIYRQRGLRGTFFCVKNSLYGVCVYMCECVCVCVSSEAAWPPNNGDAEAL